ncbi:PREDICTED: BTB/POZ domain-containing protein 19 isoform X2 [Cercocebus atys]|uniref:BTB/POZ domain-containing protein 19 isoform X2 n=1 Tax=Cercocebus atys TaxID=9531 RepID=UPI0005F548EC|nr:PREDICTED: BTB/POZ domain-containing protein 19 isoform X2 [Cercocebus atys]
MEPLGLVVHGKAEPFSAALRSLVNNPRYSDVCFVVGQERQEVFAHRCLLACRCNFFQRLLGTEPGPGVPSPVVLSTVPTEAFLAVLEFLYTNSVKLHRHSVSPLTRVLGGRGGGCQRQEFAHYTVGIGQGKLPSTPPTTHSTGARSADSGCGIWAGGTERGGRNLWPGAAAGALRGFHRGPQPGGPQVPRLPGAVSGRAAAPAPQRQALRGRGWTGPRGQELGARGRGEWGWGSARARKEVRATSPASGWQDKCLTQGWRSQAVLERPVAEVAAPVVKELRLALLAPAELSALEEQNRQEPLIPAEQIVEAWKCHALRRGDEARGAPCRRRRGTLPREHHRFLDLSFK